MTAKSNLRLLAGVFTIVGNLLAMGAGGCVWEMSDKMLGPSIRGKRWNALPDPAGLQSAIRASVPGVTLVFCCVILLIPFPGHASSGQSLKERLLLEEVIVASHRAIFATDMDENSLSGIKACAANGIEMVEIDLAESKDGKLFLLHDQRLDRTTTGTGLLSDLYSHEIKEYTLNKTGETIPSFPDALAMAKELGLFLMLDVKEVAFTKVLDQVAASGMERRVLVLTFSNTRAQEAFQVSKHWLVSVLVRQEDDVAAYIKMAPDKGRLLFYVNQRADIALFETVQKSGIPIITDANRFLDAQAKAEGGHHYQAFLQTRRPSILVSDYATLARSANATSAQASSDTPASSR